MPPGQFSCPALAHQCMCDWGRAGLGAAPCIGVEAEGWGGRPEPGTCGVAGVCVCKSTEGAAVGELWVGPCCR